MTDAFETQLSLVCELQSIDLNLHNLRTELEKLPDALKDIETAYNVTGAELKAVKDELAAAEHAKRNDEMELAASVDHLRNREAKLYSIKTNKEYQAALKEVSDGKKANREREDRILALMEKIDTLTQKNTQLSQEFADKESEYKAKQEEISRAEAAIREKMKSDEARRPAVAAAIDKALLHKYEFVRQRYASAMAGIVNGVCQGCSRKIPPQLFNEMLRRDELKACPNCQRLIYVVVVQKPDEPVK